MTNQPTAVTLLPTSQEADFAGHLADAIRDAYRVHGGLIISFDQSAEAAARVLNTRSPQPPSQAGPCPDCGDMPMLGAHTLDCKASQAGELARELADAHIETFDGDEAARDYHARAYQAALTAPNDIEQMKAIVARVGAECERLFGLLDDIDTLDDAAKGDDGLFRERAREIQRKRFDGGITTDGYSLDLSALTTLQDTASPTNGGEDK